MKTATRNLLSRDAGLLWHPYAAVDAGAHYAVNGAQGAELLLRDRSGAEHRVVDGMASWWSMVHGYRNPVLDAAAHAQIEKFSHVMFGGLTHEPAVELAERLVSLAPPNLRHVFLADSGSISVEVALKLALQYQDACGKPERQRFMALRGGYHGDTFAAMSVCDPQDGMHAAFAPLCSEQIFLPRPPAAEHTVGGGWIYDEEELDAWESQARRLAAKHAQSLAGIIFEPLLQGAGGMYLYPPRVIAVLRELADKHGLLLIADEIATGFGRTGQLFAVQHAQVEPDIMCVGKALTGGYLSLAAMLCSSHVAQVLAGGGASALLHGPTFMGNPLACSIACASVDLLTGTPETGGAAARQAPWQEQVARLERALRSSLASARTLPQVKAVRVLGGVGVIQLRQPVDVARVTAAAVERGAWVRPFRDLVYVMPPYICTDDQLQLLGAALCGAVEQVYGGLR
ncbi:adenosylmethionine--8-amino-7-oxononanoate transaminase [Glutamicibacter sp.]|uniref:adenosylmethionine--8-amino-7-oxononanoate transaminase n=1 Tax=Glutamicibacter sp. TaxID=1931995 RepID=UPI0028BEBBAB|nr:adenosylmethionine--8-amino-7-oxononanoate transaminase [Glutamicibacter sp.]